MTFSAVIFSGCDKDDDDDTPDPVNPNTELLTAKTWEVGETYQVLSGTRIHYVKGGENTSGVSMEALRIKFNEDGTGSITDAGGITYSLVWSFSFAEKSTIHMTAGTNIVIDWCFADIEANTLLQSANVTTNSLSTSKWAGYKRIIKLDYWLIIFANIPPDLVRSCQIKLFSDKLIIVDV